MGRTVLLHHRLPDGCAHFDWLIERDRLGPLLSFRVSVRLDQPRAGPFHARRIPDHRREYLEYQGPVSHDRGEVVRVAEGRAEIQPAGDDLLVDLDFGGGPQRYRGTPQPGSVSGEGEPWVFAPIGLEPERGPR